MGQTAIEELLRRSNGLYRLVILAAKRAKELAEGAPRLIEGGTRKATSVALEEIVQGKVLYKAAPEEGAGKKGRRSKEEKKRAA